MHALSVIKDIVKQQVIRSYGYALCNSSYFHYSRISITDASHDEVPKHNFVFAKSTETIAKWNARVILRLVRPLRNIYCNTTYLSIRCITLDISSKRSTAVATVICLISWNIVYKYVSGVATEVGSVRIMIRASI